MAARGRPRSAPPCEPTGAARSPVMMDCGPLPPYRTKRTARRSWLRLRGHVPSHGWGILPRRPRRAAHGPASSVTEAAQASAEEPTMLTRAQATTLAFRRPSRLKSAVGLQAGRHLPGRGGGVARGLVLPGLPARVNRHHHAPDGRCRSSRPGASGRSGGDWRRRMRRTTPEAAIAGAAHDRDGPAGGPLGAPAESSKGQQDKETKA